MRRSKMFLHTLKEVPSEAEVVSHKLMLRSGMIRKVAAGIYDILPLGLIVLRKIENIVREELNKAGAQEILMPSIQPAELWRESGRWKEYGKELLRFKDRHSREFCYGPTHEEVVTDLVRKEIKSYKQLPLNIYQIQTKFRDEIRPRFGVMRSREFLMKDGYSFDVDDDSSEETYKSMFEAYKKIFINTGLKFRAVEADSGLIGGVFSHEFMVLAESGEDLVVSCDSCDYASNMEKARSEHEVINNDINQNEEQIEDLDTPDKKSVDDICDYLNVDPTQIVKTLIFETENGIYAVLVRGDHDVNETKLKNLLKCDVAVLAGDNIIKEITGAPPGFSGPVGLTVDIVADDSVVEMKNYIVGGNQVDTHLKNVNHPRDFKIALSGDIRSVKPGDKCPNCEGRLKVDRGIEVGHVFKLGTKYSEKMKATFLDASGAEKPLVMGCYGIGIARTLAASIEQNHDENGIVWPVNIAPFKVVILPLNIKDAKSKEVSEDIYKKLKTNSVETLIDDRNDRAGIKFKDADLIGVPYQIIIGPKNISNNKVEIKTRKTGEKIEVAVEEAVEYVTKNINVTQ